MDNIIIRGAVLQLIKSRHSSFGSDMSTRGVRASDDSSISDGECIPRASRRNVCKARLEIACAKKCNNDNIYLQVAPLVAAEASIVGLFQLLMVSRTPSSSSPRVVKPVTLRPAITDFPVEGSMTPGKMAPPWQLQNYVSLS